MSCGTRCLILIVAIASSSALAIGESPKSQRRTAIDSPPILNVELMNRAMHRFAQYGFSGVVLVSQEGEPIFEFAGGRLEGDNSPPMSMSALFDLASVSKQFVSAIILDLASEGRVKLQDTLSGYFEDGPAALAPITVRQLLDHTSGLGSIDPIVGKEATSRELLSQILHTPPRWAPGERFDYENTNYNLLALLIEKIERRPFSDVLESRIAAPLGIDILYPLGELPIDAGPLAHEHIGVSGAIQTMRNPPLVSRLGSGGITTSAAGLQEWINALIRGQAMSPNARAQLLSWPAGQEPVYRFGWEFRLSPEGERVMEIAGDLDGVQHQVQHYPDHDLDVIVLCNTRVNRFRWRERIAQELGTIALGREPNLPADLFDSAGHPTAPLDGVYRSELGTLTVHVLDHRVLQVDGSGQRIIDLLTGLDEVRRSKATHINPIIDRAFTELAQQSFAGFESIMSAATSERFKSDWSELTGAMGALSSHEILGSIPNGDTRLTTIARLTLAGGASLDIKLFWLRSSLHLNGWMVTDQSPASVYCFADRDGWHRMFDPQRVDEFALRFEIGGRPPPTILTSVGREEGPVTWIHRGAADEPRFSPD